MYRHVAIELDEADQTRQSQQAWYVCYGIAKGRQPDLLQLVVSVFFIFSSKMVAVVSWCTSYTEPAHCACMPIRS